jgi:hypothetical protein
MPRAKAKEIVIGFIGTGEMAVNPATTLIEEYLNKHIGQDDPVRFVFPLVTDEFTDTMGELVSMARASKISYEVVTSGNEKKRAFTDIANAAAKTYNVTDVWTQMESILVDAPQSVLMVLVDPDREREIFATAAHFVDAGIKAVDLTGGNRVLELSPRGEEAEPDADQEGPEEDGEEEEGEEEAEEEEKPESEEAQAPEGFPGTIPSRAVMEKMSHAEVKEIALALGLAPRKARENMIVAILETASTPQSAPVGSVEPQVVTETVTAVSAPALDLTVIGDILDQFGERFFDGLERWSTGFVQQLEGIQFNLAPEKPMDMEEEPEPRRRLSRN